MTRYRQPPPPRRSGLALAARILAGALLLLLMVGLGLAGGAYLYFHQAVAAVRAHTPEVRAAARRLDVALPGQATIALLLGNNQRTGVEASAGGRSDTIMLIRADPQTKAISLLSIPRDLIVPIYCPGSTVPRATTRIDYAFAWCGPSGSLLTVRRLTGLPVNYLITVDFRGFKRIVNDLGGIWLDVDRRYYNRNDGSAATDYSNIDLQPGYQLLTGGSALAFVRYRHTDSDFYRQARQQEFLRALKAQVARNFDPLKLPALVSAVTSNVEVGAKSDFGDSTVLGYALFGVTLPAGHILQTYVSGATDVNVGGAEELQAPQSAIDQAVEQFTHPDPGASSAANAAALGVKPKPRRRAPSPQQTTITVLNGSAVPGAAANTSYLLSQRGYRTLLPPNGAAPNAPTQSYFHTQIYFDPSSAGARAAAERLQPLFAPAEVHALPDDPSLRALDPGAMVVLVVGDTFHGTLATPAPPAAAPTHEPPAVGYEPSASRQLLAPLARRVPFRLELPTVLERSSSPDTLPGDTPVELYTIVRGHKAVRLVYRTGGGEYWGVEETDWRDAPILTERSFQHDLGGREFQLYYSGQHLHMVVLQAHGASYWVVNTLLDSLSNETMLAIARGLQPLPAR